MHTTRNDEAKRKRSRHIASRSSDDSDRNAGFVVTENFTGFSQVDDVFCRSQYDPEVKTPETQRFYEMYRKPLTGWRGAEGYGQHDYALRNATWHIADIFAEMYEFDDRRDGFLDPLSMLRNGSDQMVTFTSPDEASRVVKQAAQTVGADLIGITEYDSRWTYTERFSM
ncbi:MAG: hypothetical protein VX725_02040, partial [Actinomycetota bacterium]|nr:hypothetical protein [Actinomycetota bacterium]